MKKCTRGGERVNFSSAPGQLNEDLSDIFCQMLKEKVNFVRVGGPREYGSGITLHEPDKYALQVTGTMSPRETDFYPLDIVITEEAAAEYYHNGSVAGFKDELEKLVAAHARNYNQCFSVFGDGQISEFPQYITKETPMLLIGPADTITAGAPKLGYLFLQGTPEKGYRLESECSFKFTTAERR